VSSIVGVSSEWLPAAAASDGVQDASSHECPIGCDADPGGEGSIGGGAVAELADVVRAPGPQRAVGADRNWGLTRSSLQIERGRSGEDLTFVPVRKHGRARGFG